MSSFRKRSPTGSRPQRSVLLRSPGQNPQRWRNAFGDIRSLVQPEPTQWGQSGVTATSSGGGGSDSSIPQGSLYEGLPEPGLIAAEPSIFELRRSRPIQTQPKVEPTAKSILWKSSFRKPEDPVFRTSSPPPPLTNDRELEDLIGKPVFSAEDRYKVLDGLDKLIRKRNPKVKVRVEFAVKLAGTCRDMCPEKERYMREVQRRVSSYECDDSQQDSAAINHQLAVKEYSRSSADQEEPLPHDLRPILSLNLTFDYLLHNIINLIEYENESLSDMYYYVWDRTRAIRKDMTQQQLGTTDAVLLMEKCARFHIYCSTRLCELDRHAFDPKLNDENLMKCLQSLEHMYADLVPHGIECPNEPEFRAYQILMHLNEGDIVRGIQQKPDRILKSGPVTHALKIYVALNSMNSVAFFRLVEKSSFMVSSILHRYFFQVRTNALRRFLKTFSLKSQISIPTMQVKRMLGFGSGDENMFSFKYFCEAHGFPSANIGPVAMTMRSRSEFEQPEFNLMFRESWLVESKLRSSVSEAINGAPLGQNPLDTYIPQTSFDANGNFNRDLLDGLSLAPKSTPSTPSQTPPQPPRAPAIAPSISDLRGRLGVRPKSNSDPNIPIKPVTETVPDSASTFRFSTPAPTGFNFSLATAPKFSSTLPPVGATQPSFSFTVPKLQDDIVAAEKRKAEEAKKVAAIGYASALAQTLLQEVVVKEAREMAARVRQEWVLEEAKLVLEKALAAQIYKELESTEIQQVVKAEATSELGKAHRIDEACKKIEDDLLSNVATEVVKLVAAEVLHQMQTENSARLKQMDGICGRITLRHWLVSWRRTAAERKLNRIRELQRQEWNVENFPPILTSQFRTEMILSDWGGFAPLVEKPLRENTKFELVERAMDLKRCFKKHVEDFRSSVIHHLETPLLQKLDSVPVLPPLCSPWHPPLTINVALINDFEPWNHLALWTWTSLSADSVPLSDPAFCAHQLPCQRQAFLTFQKCQDVANVSSDTRAVLCFQPKEGVVDMLKMFESENPEVPVIIYGGTSLKSHFKNVFEVTSHHDVVENLPAIVCGLSLIGPKVEVTPAVILLPLIDFAATMFRDIFGIRYKSVTCPQQLYAGHRSLIQDFKSLVQNKETLGVLKKWPGRATKLVIQKFAKDICFSHELGMLGVVLKNWKEIESLLTIDPPQDLIERWHQGGTDDEVMVGLRREFRTVTGSHEISDELRTRFNYLLSQRRKECGNLAWKQFLEVCQNCVLEKLAPLPFSTYEVCVNLHHLEQLQRQKLDLTRCSHCSGNIGGRKRAFSLDKDFSTLIPFAKTVKDDPELLLSSMQGLLQEMKAEKEELEASFSELEKSIVSD